VNVLTIFRKIVNDNKAVETVNVWTKVRRIASDNETVIPEKKMINVLTI
jgi:hypothetical protein